MQQPKIKITQDPEKPIERNVLAKAITDIATAAKSLVSGGLNRNAIIVLVQDKTGLPKRDIAAVLNALESLQRDYCR